MLVTVKGRRKDLRALWWERGAVRAIDQRVLPATLRISRISTHEEMARAIAEMAIRGAPSIGAAGAYGMALAQRRKDNLARAARLLKATRPTAHDLFHAVDLMLRKKDEDLIEAADRYADEIVSMCQRIGQAGAGLITTGDRILTHCNAGALATVDYGTALAPIRLAHRQGKDLFVYVDETRPRLQGAKLTAWELSNEGIDHAIITDNAAGHYMKRDIDLVLVGADRIARNGDFANKIGTYEKAVLAKENGVPFYVAAPASTFDLSIKDGTRIPIEERPQEEVLLIEGVRIAPRKAKALNPAFDVTPARYVNGFITEKGVVTPRDFSRLAK